MEQGFSGIYQLYKFRQLGLSVKAVGGLFWSRRGLVLESLSGGEPIPGSKRCFCYTWDPEDLQTYPWRPSLIFPKQRLLAYLNHIVKRHDLAKDIQLNARMESAQFVDNAWRVRLSTGEVYIARYLATGLGKSVEDILSQYSGPRLFHRREVPPA